MLATAAAIFPVFTLVGAAFLCRKSGLFGATSAAELNKFVYYLALPVLLFDIMACAKWDELAQPGFIAAFGLSMALVFALALIPSVVGNKSSTDTAIESFIASYANVGYIGFPLCASLLGHEGLTPAMMATILTVCILFAATLVIIEFHERTESKRRAAIKKITSRLAYNPLLVAPLLGLLWNATGIPLPGLVESPLKMLGAAASPCALVSLGALLAAHAPAFNKTAVTKAVTMKLFLQPGLTWVMAFHVFSMPPIWANAAVILAALPTGPGAYMLAEQYKRQTGTASSSILISTVASILTLTIVASCLRI